MSETKKQVTSKEKQIVSKVDATPTPRDREIQKYLVLPIGRNRGLFSDWEDVPWLSDLIEKKQKELSAEYQQHINLQPHEIRELQRESKTYKESGILYKEIENGFAIGFGFRTYLDFLRNGKKKRKQKDLPLFDELEERRQAEDLGNEIFQKIKSLHLYTKGQDILEYLLSEAHHQRRHDQISISQKALSELLDPHGSNPNIGQDIKEIMDAFSWISYKIKDREGKEIVVGNFIYELRYDGRKKEFIVSINPRFLGCTQAALQGNMEDRSKAERKELFGGGEGYYYASIRKIFLCNARNFSISQRQLIDYLLIHRGENVKENGKEYKMLIFRIGMLIFDESSPLKYKGEASVRYKKFIEDIKEALISGTSKQAKLEPPIEKLQNLRASDAANLVIKCYIPRNLEQIWQEALKEEVGILVLDKEKFTSEQTSPIKIRLTRQERCLTQNDLAKILGVTKQFISSIEQGKKSISSLLEKKINQWLNQEKKQV